MKMNGDVPQEDRDLAEELIKMEEWFDAITTISTEIKAKSYVCFAHDWYVMGMDEEGHRLILKAEAVHPGYSKDLMKSDMETDPQYDFIVKNIAKQLILLIGSLEGK